MNRKNSFVGSIMLTVCAIIWGSSFVAQSQGAEFVTPFTFISIRSLLGGISLLPVIFISDSVKKKRNPELRKKKTTKAEKKYFLLGALACGSALSIASVLQQFGIDRGTSSGKAGFITALYILLVPIFSVVLKKKIRPLIWPCVGVFLVGLYLLCVTDNSIQFSDLYVLLCAIVYAIHILVIDKVSPNVDGIKLSCAQFIIAGLILSVPMLLFENVPFELIRKAAFPIAYSGIMSSGVAFTLQILGQQRTEPTLASMLMSLESVFAMITGMIILHEIPTGKETFGCVLMFIAIIVAQLPDKNDKATA